MMDSISKWSQALCQSE